MAGKLSNRQAAFVAAYIGEAKQVGAVAARMAGYADPKQAAYKLLRDNEVVKAAVEEWRAELREKSSTTRDNRMASYEDRLNRMRRLVEARAADPELRRIPGGDSGLLSKVPKVSTFDGVEYEYATDAALLKEWRELEKQVAIERGEWQEKPDVQVNVGIRQLIGVDVDSI